jgi:hypothetical protein
MRITEGTLNPKPTYLLTGASHVEKCCVDVLNVLILVSLVACFIFSLFLISLNSLLNIVLMQGFFCFFAVHFSSFFLLKL